MPSEFLDLLYPDDIPEGNHLLIWSLPDKVSRWCPSVDAAVKAVEAQPATNDVYVGCGLRSDKFVRPNVRGGVSDVTGIPGLWAEVDIEETSDKAYPPTEQAALALLDELRLPPSLIIHSGHGLHAYWLFKETWMFDSSEERTEAANLSKRLYELLKLKAERHNWRVDNMSDLARVLRVPGTINNKDNPAPVKILNTSDSRYNPDDLDQILPPVTQVDDSGDRDRLVGTLNLDPMAEPPYLKISALTQFEDDFRDTWEQTRSDENRPFPSKDYSQSTYDLALATFAARTADWTDQEICNLLIANRRLHQGPENLAKKLKNRAYWISTIAKAKSERVIPEASRELDNSVTAADSGFELDDETKHQMNRNVARILGLPWKYAITYLETPRTYAAIVGDNNIFIGTAKELRNCQHFADRLMDELKVVLSRHSGSPLKKNWSKIVSTIVKAGEVQEVARESTEEGQTEGWVRSFVETWPPLEWESMENFQVSIRPTQRTFVRDGEVYIFLRQLSAFIKGAMGENHGTNVTLSRRLKRIGFESRVVKCGSSSCSCFVAPENSSLLGLMGEKNSFEKKNTLNPLNPLETQTEQGDFGLTKKTTH